MKRILFFLFFIFPILIFAQKKAFLLDPALKPGDYKPYTLVVKFKANPTGGKTFNDNTSIKKLKGKVKQVFPKSNSTNLVNNNNLNSNGKKDYKNFSLIHYVDFDPKISIKQAISMLFSDSNIEYAEPIFTNYQPFSTPNDPLLSSEYQLNNIKAYSAWDIQKGDPSMVIGIVDYGFDVTHPDLVANMVPGFNVADNNTSLGGTGSGHGTFAAGCSSAIPNNNIGIAGTGYNCKFMPIRGSSDISPGVFEGFAGLQYAVDNGCKVVNLSWGRMCGGYSQAEQDMIDYAAISNDAVVVVAAGNTTADAYWYPAAYDHVISVGYTDINDKIGIVGGFQNFGCGNFLRGSSYNDKVSIMAPGYGVYSTSPGNNYTTNTGSSFAAPIVSGAAALLRVQYPLLNSQQIIERLISTADNIDNVVGNSPYIGKIGAGRLNMFRALTDSLKSVSMVSRNITGLKNQPYLLNNFTSNMVIKALNSLNALPNIQVKLSSNSPYIIMKDSIAVLGDLKTKDTISNTSHPFKIFVKPGTPSNSEIVFQLTFYNGTYSYTQNFIEIANPDYLDVNINNNLTTVTSKGRFGYNDDFNRYGKGYNYNPFKINLLSEGGLIIGSSNTRISDATRSSPGLRNQSFSVVAPLAFDNDTRVDFSAAGIFTDTVSNPNKNGIVVNQHVYAWKDSLADKFVIHQYDIKNVSGSDINHLYAGIFADWDMIEAANNYVIWDSLRNMGIMFNYNYNTPFSGICLLTPQAPQFYALDDQYGGVNPYDGFTLTEKFTSISSGVFRKTSTFGATDASYSIAGRMDSLKNNTSQTIAYAFVTGKNAMELFAQAQIAKARFCQLNKPLASFNMKGKFYNDTLITSIDTVAQFTDKSVGALSWNWDFGGGKKSKLQNPTQNFSKIGTYKIKLYVQNSTGCQDSVIKFLNVLSCQLKKPIVNFAMKGKYLNDTLISGIDTVLQFTDKSIGAVSWNWDFGGGKKSNIQSPQQNFSILGKYPIKLVVQNVAGCKDSLIRTLTVTTLLTGTEPNYNQDNLLIFPNPTEGNLNIQAKNNFILSNSDLIIYNSLGNQIFKTKAKSENEEISLTGISKGLYFLNIRSDKKNIIKKIIIQ